MYKAKAVPTGSRVKLSDKETRGLIAIVVGQDWDGMYAVQLVDDDVFPGHNCRNAKCSKIRKHFREFPGGGWWVNRSDMRSEQCRDEAKERERQRKKAARRRGRPPNVPHGWIDSTPASIASAGSCGSPRSSG